MAQLIRRLREKISFSTLLLILRSKFSPPSRWRSVSRPSSAIILPTEIMLMITEFYLAAIMHEGAGELRRQGTYLIGTCDRMRKRVHDHGNYLEVFPTMSDPMYKILTVELSAAKEMAFQLRQSLEIARRTRVPSLTTQLQDYALASDLLARIQDLGVGGILLVTQWRKYEDEIDRPKRPCVFSSPLFSLFFTFTTFSNSFHPPLQKGLHQQSVASLNNLALLSSIFKPTFSINTNFKVTGLMRVTSLASMNSSITNTSASFHTFHIIVMSQQPVILPKEVMFKITEHYLSAIVRAHSRQFDFCRLSVTHSFKGLYNDLKAYLEAFPHLSKQMRKSLNTAWEAQRTRRTALERRRKMMLRQCWSLEDRYQVNRAMKRNDVKYRTLNSLKARWEWEERVVRQNAMTAVSSQS